MKSIREALTEVRNLDNHPLVKKAKQAHQRGIWNGNVDKDGNPIVHINGKPYTVEMEQVSENLRDLENMFGRGATDWRKIVKKNRRDLEAFQKGRKDLPKKVEDELLKWAMDNGEVRNKDDADDFIDIVLNAGHEPEGEVISEMTQRFAFDNLKKATAAEKSAPRYNLRVDSGVEGKIYYVAVTGKFTDITKWMKTLVIEETSLEERHNSSLAINPKTVNKSKPLFQKIAKQLGVELEFGIDGHFPSVLQVRAKSAQASKGFYDAVGKDKELMKLIENENLDEAGTPVARDSKFEVIKYPSGLYSINFVNVRDGDIFIGKEDLMRFKTFMSKVKV